MATLLDLIGSFLFGALLTLSVMRVNAHMAEQAYQGSQALIAQGHAVALQEIIEADFRRMGIGVTGPAIMQADASQIQFTGDLTSDGAIDTLHYAISNPSAASDTPHPADRVLYRTHNGNTPQAMRLGITVFQLTYYDAAGNALPTPIDVNAVRQVEVALTVESTTAYDSTYARALLQFRVFPKNLGL